MTLSSRIGKARATGVARACRPVALAVLVALWICALASPALAGPPTHTRREALDVSGFNHACGTAVDSKGNLYVASAGESKIKVFSPAHGELTSIANPNEPCGLAVDSNGGLFVVEKATGKVVRYKPNSFPFSGTPSYGAAEPIDSSGNARGISVDRSDDRLYVARGSRIDSYNPDGSLGETEVQQIRLFSPSGGTFRLAMPAEGAAGRNEVQFVRRGNNATGNGTFTLAFEGQATAPIPQEASAAEVEASLEALSTIDPGDVSVSGFPGVRGYWIEFTGSLGEQDVPLIDADGADLEDANKIINVGAYSDISDPIPFDATAGEVEARLEELSGIGSGNVEVEKPDSTYVVTFSGALAKANVDLLAGDGTGLENVSFSGVAASTLIDGFSGHIGEGALGNAIGVAAYSYKVSSGDVFNPSTYNHYLFVADAATDEVKILSGFDLRKMKLRETLSGVDQDANPETPEQEIGFGASGAYLGVDPGNRSAEDKCSSVAEQACTAGHFLVYDAAHAAVDEFDASGEFLDQIKDPGFSDAGPTGLAVERSGTANDGTIYITVGSGPGAKLLAFGPLATPSRLPLPQLSHVLTHARAVATDRVGNVYVAAETMIHVYRPDGTELTKFEDARRAYDLAVDSTGKVYVLDDPNAPARQLTYYTPTIYPPASGTAYARHEPSLLVQLGLGNIAINPVNDHVLVGESGGGAKILEFGSAQEGSPATPIFAPFFSFFGGSQGIDVYGARGTVFTAGNASSIDVIDAAGTEQEGKVTGAGCPSGTVGFNPGIAVDQSNGHLLEVQPTQPGHSAREYDASGACVAEFGTFGTDNSTPYDIAADNSCALHDPPLTEATVPTCKQFDPANGNLYVAYDASNGTIQPYDLVAFGPLAYGEAPLAAVGIANGLGAGNATLEGTVDPRGFELEECRFQLIADAQYVSNGKTFAGATSLPCTESLPEIGKGTGAVPVHAGVAGLDPEARYRFRLLAQNKYGEAASQAALFGPPGLTAKSAQPILYTEATLRGEVDPSGLATKYHFEYGTDDAYGKNTPTVELAPGDGPVAVEAPLTGLSEGTEYHYRLVAENEARAGEGPDQIFVTQTRPPSGSCPNAEYRIGPSANLPDCRAYELVTPAETHGLEPNAVPGALFNDWMVKPRGPGAGETLAYFAGTLPGFEGTGETDGYRAQRSPGAHPSAGWSSELVGPTYAQTGGGTGNNQRGFASDQLYSLWYAQPVEVFDGTLAKGSYLRTPTGFELLGHGSLGADPEAEGRFVSAGGAHVVFLSKEHLEDEAPAAGAMAVYDRAAGDTSAEVVSVKPDGSPFGAAENATYVGASEDGSAVLFSVAGVLYLHRGGQTTEIATAPNAFAGISEDGKRVFYMDTANAATPSPAALFACDAEAGSCAGPEATHPPIQIAANSLFANVSSDGSHAFFTSEDALTGAEENETGEIAETGERNLYAWDGSSTRFIAVLDPRDFVFFSDQEFEDMFRWTDSVSFGDRMGRGFSPTRSTPDGRTLVFQSHAQLTAYDNEGHGEIYRYEPAAPLGGRLICISCDPGDSPSSGDALLQIFAPPGHVQPTTAIPGVTDNGRSVFFHSPDRLLPEDANGATDVYEWTANGAGGCNRPRGCLALISSGQGEVSSYLYSMSADGRDVFIETPDKLVGQDIPGSVSIYDARVEGGIPDQPAKAPCQGDACQGVGSAPPALPSPSSTTLGAGGNLPREAKPRCGKDKRKVSRNGKTRCVSKHKKKRHRKRANDNGRARR